MSGLAKGIKKIFKAVGKVIKKLAPIILVAGAAFLTGGFGLAGGAGAAGAAGAAGGAAGGGGLSGIMSSIFGGGGAAAGGAAAAGSAAGAAAGGGGLLSTVLSSPITGKVISGAATGYANHLQMQAEEKAMRDAERRQDARYEGAGDATEVGGLGVRPQETSDSTPAPAAEQPIRPGRRSVLQSADRPSAPRYQYNPDSGRIEYS